MRSNVGNGESVGVGVVILGEGGVVPETWTVGMGYHRPHTPTGPSPQPSNTLEVIPKTEAGTGNIQD